jgi:hypothetical protein
MAAIIDWHSKAVLSYKISNTMDSQLVMSVLNDALEKHPHPEIFNTDQGSQYTSIFLIPFDLYFKVALHYPKTSDNFLKFLI